MNDKIPTHRCDVNPMSYVAWHEKAARLTRKKIRQERCPICKLLKFPDEQCADFMVAKATQNV